MKPSLGFVGKLYSKPDSSEKFMLDSGGVVQMFSPSVQFQEPQLGYPNHVQPRRLVADGDHLHCWFPDLFYSLFMFYECDNRIIACSNIIAILQLVIKVAILVDSEQYSALP